MLDTPPTRVEDGMTDQPFGWSAPDLPVAAAAPVAAASAPTRRLLPLRPLATGELLDGGVVLTRAFPRAVLAFSTVLAVTAAVVDLVVTLALLGPLTTSADDLATDDQALRDLLGAGAATTAVSLLVSIVTGAVMAGVMTVVVGRAVTGEQTTPKDAWAQLRPRAAALLGLSALVGLGVYGTFFGSVVLFALLALTGAGGALLGLLVVGGGSVAAVLLYVRWSLAPAVLVLERQGVRAALKRSSLLVRGSFLRLLGVLLLAFVIASTVSLVVQLPFQLLGYSPFDGLSSDYTLSTSDAVLGAVSGALASVLVMPFRAGVSALLYVDRRMRAEGLDLVLATR